MARRTTTVPVAVSTMLPTSGTRWLSRAAIVAVTTAALVGVYLVPAVPAFAVSGDGLSEADRAAAAAAAAPPSDESRGEDGDGGGNWFMDLFGGGDDEPEGDPIPADARLSAEEHSVAPRVATPQEPGARVRELTGERTVSTRTFLLGDGQRQVEMAGEPMFYETARDGLVEIDTAVAATDEAVADAGAKGLSVKAGRAAKAEGWSHASVANTARSYFGEEPDRVVRVEDAAGRGVTVGLPDAAKEELSSPRVDGDTVTHRDVAALDGADLSYEVRPGRVKESIVLAEAPAGDASLEYTFTLSDLGDLSPRVEDDGSIGFYSELNPDAVASIPAGVMWDSRRTETTEDGKLSAPGDQGAAVSTDVAYELERSGKGVWSLTVVPDLEWLTDEARVWPVTVDPTIIISPTENFSKDTMILSEAPTTGYYTSSRLSVGRTNGGIARSMVEFPQLADVVPVGSDVTHAELQMYFDQAHTDWATRVPLEVREVTAPWTSSSTTWNSANGLMGAVAGTRRTLNNVSPYVSTTGSWPASALGADGFGGDYQFNRDTSSGDVFTWKPNLPASGLWQVWLHNVTGSNRSTQVPIRITHATDNPVHTYLMNQQARTGWDQIAAHTFNAGTGGKVEILDTPATSSTAVIADAVRFVKPATEVRTSGEIGKWHRYDVSGTVGEWAKNPELDNGFMIKATDESSSGPLGGPRYEAGEDVYGGETRNMPRLTVTYGQPGVVVDIPDTIHATGAELSWSAYKDPSSSTGDNLVEYQVHRSVSQTFDPTSSTLIAPVAPGTTRFVDTTAVPTPADSSGVGGLYYYQVAVKRRDGTVVPSSTQIVRLPKAGHTTKVLVASGDTSLASGKPNQNWNTIQDITTQRWDLVGNASAVYGDTRTVMEWDDTAWEIPDNAVVTEAFLRMWQETTETTRTNADGSMVYPTQGVYELRRATVDFDETLATWNDPDGAGPGTWNPGGTHTSAVQSTLSGVGEGPDRLSWDAKAVTQAFANNPSWHRSLIVRMHDEEASQDRSLFASTEAEDHNGLERSGPRLSVTYLSTAPEDTFYAPDTPERMQPGVSYQVPVTVSNTTQTTWTTAGQELVASWTLPDGSVAPGSQSSTTALPQDLVPGAGAEMTATVVAPPVSDGNLRSDYSLSWEIANTASAAQEKTARQDAEAVGQDSVEVAASAQGLDAVATGDVAEQSEESTLAEAGIAALPAGKLKQNVAVEDPTSDQLGLESFYTYAGKNTGAGGTLMNNVAAGNAVWSYDAFSNPGRGLSTFARFSYNSQDTSDTVSGFGWSAQVSGPIRLGAPLEFHPNKGPREIMLPDGDGTTHVFRLNETTGQWDAPAGVNYRLTQSAADVTCPGNQDYVADAWQMLRPDGTTFVFGCDGYLNQVIDKNGNTQQFTYAERQSNNQPRKFLQYITDPTGRQTLTVDYWDKGQTGWRYVDETTGNLVDGSGKLTNSKIYDHVRSMTDVSGRTVEFYYTDKGLMGRMIDGAGATDEAGASIAKQFKFTYDADQGNKNAKLTAVTDPRGNTTRIGYYYPAEGDDPKDHWSVQTITDRLGGDTTFDYVPHATNDDWWNTSVTDAEGHATKYVSDDFGRPRSVTNAKSETVALTWDGDNNVRTLTEANGAVTAYCYDPKTGYPLWQRDAEQNAAQGGAPAASECVPGESAELAPAGAQVMEYQTWENGHVAQIARTTSPEGRKNQFTYDAVGNLLTVTDGKGIATATAGDYTTSYTYDDFGQLLTVTDANENVTKYRGYTAVGYPEVTEDALGNVSRTTYSNDGRGLVTQVEDPLDGLVTQAYDAFGRPLAGTTRKSADETITTPAAVYDANDNVTVSTAPNGAVSTATYDKADQVTASTMPKDTETGPERVSQFEYDTVGNVLKTTEPKGVATTADATDFVTTFRYDAIYQQTSVTNADGDVISYTYDEVGNLVKTVDPKKNASADPDDFTSTTEYDLNHRPVSATDAAGNTSSTAYDADGLAVSSTDPDGNTSHVTYDERGAQVETKSPHESVDGVVQYRTTQVEYDEVGNTTRVVTPRGVATADPDDFASRTEYDALNRPVKQFQPYDPADTRYNDANVFTETTYDAAGRVVKTSLPPSEGQTVRNESVTEFFDNGWIKKSSDAWDISTTYEYDDLGAQTARTLTSADGSANRTMSWSYFPDGKLESKSDDGVPVGSHSVVTDNSTWGLAKATGTWKTWWSAPDQQGTSYRTHDPVSGASTDEFTWTLDVPADGTYSLAVTYPQASGAATDATFELTHGKDGDGHGGVVTEPAYVVDQSTGAGAWNDVGRVELRKGDPVTVTLKPSATGKVVADAVRLVRDNAADTDTEARAFAYSYDVNGNLTGINDTSSGARADDYQITYTGLNHVASVKEALAGQDTATTSYSYDVLGQPVTVDHPDQASTYEYEDPRHLLTQVSVDDLNDTAGAKVTQYTYDNRGMRATETKANGNVVTNGYFLDGALKSLREEKSGGALVSSHAYTYDDNGNKHTDVASKANADVAGAYLESTTTYSYDPAERLAESVKTGNGAETETYVHDDNANVISQDVGGTATTYTYDRNRLLTAATGGAAASYRYDPFGRQTSVVSAGLTISRTTYDGFDHIAESEKMNDAGALESTTYAYDPLDRTASKTAGGETTDYTYLGVSSEVLGEEVAGQLTKSYQYSPWGQRLSQITHQADPEAGVEAGESAYYGYNSHTDVETLTDDAGNTVATYGYTAYGNADEAEYTGIDKPEAGAPEDAEPYNAYRYNSKRWDASSGTYDMGFRDYNPGLNRFTTRDMYNGALANMSLGADPYTGNRYAFTAGNPISRIEMDGHEPRPIHQGAAGPNTAGWVAAAPTVTNSKLENILGDIYAKPGSTPAVGSGKAAEALIYELETGKPTKGLFHSVDVGELLRRISMLTEQDRKARSKGNALLTESDLKIAQAEARELWDALDRKVASSNPVLQDLKDNPGKMVSLQGALRRVSEAPSMRSVTGTSFAEDPYKGPRLTGQSKLPGLLNSFGVAGDVLFIFDSGTMLGDAWMGDHSRSCADAMLATIVEACQAPVPPA